MAAGQLITIRSSMYWLVVGWLLFGGGVACRVLGSGERIEIENRLMRDYVGRHGGVR
jgi:chromate transport protein ChrA